MPYSDEDMLTINCLRFLAVDAVEKAQSGHPGMPMGAAALAYVLWDRYLTHNPKDPAWFNRDRFVLSNGHGSMLLYGLLHLSGYDLPLKELENFRQWGSMTPGHPEYGHTPGIETTTGPLGQGFANAVGMAIAEKHLAAVYNRPGLSLIDHHTFAIAGDGCLMEGITHEAASLAGHLGLEKLIVLYDDNHISIDGSTDLAFTEDVLKRFDAYEWHTQRVTEGNDCDAIEDALAEAIAEHQRPSIIAVRTHIGFGSPNKQDNADAHGSPLGTDEVKLTKQNLQWPLEPTFYIPEEARQFTNRTLERGENAQRKWNELLKRYEKEHPGVANELQAAVKGRLPEGWDSDLSSFTDAMATRKASGKIINAIAGRVSWLVGGSADLTPSNNTYISGSDNFSKETPQGRNFHFGVREHAMGAALNGMVLHGGLKPYGGTFLVFSDYMRPAVRLASLMNIPTTFVYTHDSVGLGEDGPTHQPIEHLGSLRAIPNLIVIRPADGNETIGAWKFIMPNADSPVALVLTRQKVTPLPCSPEQAIDGALRGAHVVAGEGDDPDLTIIATGSEVGPALEAAARLKEHSVRVVSMPSWELFDRQPEPYKNAVIPPSGKRLSIEAGATFGWSRWTSNSEASIGINRFGASAPGTVVLEKLGISAEAVLVKARELLR
jgi:transketolase